MAKGTRGGGNQGNGRGSPPRNGEGRGAPPKGRGGRGAPPARPPAPRARGAAPTPGEARGRPQSEQPSFDATGRRAGHDVGYRRGPAPRRQPRGPAASARQAGEQGNYRLGGEEVKEESSWRYPVMILVATLVLCVIFLYHYVGPDVDELQGNKPRPTITEDPIGAQVGDVWLAVPSNYTVFPRDRRDGERETLTLYASWPRMAGYAPQRREVFVENEAEAPRIDVIVFLKKTPFTESERLDILYMPHVLDAAGTTQDHGLTLYTFRQGGELAPSSGYSDKEMLIGAIDDEQTAIFFCYPEGDNSAGVPPECFREFDLSPRVSVKYYFKRPFLAEWRTIDAEVRGLLQDFQEAGEATSAG